MNQPSELEWQKEYFALLQNFAEKARVDFSFSKLGNLQAKLIFRQVINALRNDELDLGTFAMLAEVLSQKCNPSGEVFWELLLAAELEWYQTHEPAKVESLLDSVYDYFDK
jgi:hypothetical protein